MGALKLRIFRTALYFSITPITAGASDSEQPYGVDSSRPNIMVFERDSSGYVPADSQSAPVRPAGKPDTLELPGKRSQPAGNDSLSREFKKYWAKVEEREGIDKLRAQIQSNDIDKTWFPHFYLFDSNLVIFPGWFVIRKKH